MKIIIFNPKTKLFDFFIESLKYCNFIIESYNQNSNSNNIILIIINPHFIYDYSDIDNELNNISKKFRYKILYLTEPINFLIEKKIYLEVINKVNPFCLWTYTYENFNKLNTKTKIFKIFPHYNDAYYFSNLENLKIKNNKNIVFIGNITQNRIDITNQFNNYLINFNNSWTNDDWSEIVNNYLFYLNIHRRIGCKSFESFRIIPILSNGGIIFSERCNEKEELIYTKYNIIFVERDKLYDTFLNYINNINYDIILEKTLKFRSDCLNNDFDQLNFFLDFTNNII